MSRFRRGGSAKPITMDKQTQKKLFQIVKDNYDRIADHYSETRKKEIWPELNKLAEPVNNGNKILDVGCGSGKLLDVFLTKDVEYLGIDSCSRLLQHANERYQGGNKLKRDKIEFRKGDILNLGEFNELDFDFVFCIAVLQHIPGEDMRMQALRQLKNKVNSDGRVIISVWNMWETPKTRWPILKFFLLKLIKKNQMDLGDIFFDWKNAQGEIISKRYYHAFTKRELKKLFKKVGFKIEKLYYDKYNYYAVLRK